MLLRKLMPGFIIFLFILQIISAFTLVSPVMAIIGCLIILVSAIRWGLYGGFISATLCAALLLITHMLSILQVSGWMSVIITVVLYYALGVGIGGVLGTIRKQKAALTASEERYISANLELANEKERLNLTLSSIGDGVIATDENGNITMMNKVASQLTGWDAQDAMNRPFSEVFDMADGNSGLSRTNPVADVLREGRLIELDQNAILTSKNGIKMNITVSISPIKKTEGGVFGVIAIFDDITELKRSEDAIKLSEKKFSSYIGNAPDGVFVVDDKGQYLEVNRAATEMTGYSKDELLHMTIRDILSEESQEAGMNDFFTLLEKGSMRGSLQYKHKDGTKKWMALDAVKLTEHSFLGFAKDITYQKKVEEQLLHISYHDQLTGLGNRRFYEEELKRLDTKINLPLTFVMGDVNGLKLINDSFGHTMGDQLLKKVAEVIKTGCRADDMIARVGGDEFIIVLPKTDALEAEQIIQRMKELSFKEKVCGMDISISFGYATKSSEEEDIQEIFVHAEDLMYRHKRAESTGNRSKTIDLVLNTLYKKSGREQLHSIQVSEICAAIASKMGFSKNDVNQIKIAGLMHDIGKIEIDEKILNKPEKLSKDEWERMQRHPEIGYRILNSINGFSAVADAVLEHQERWDGKGYPRGLKGEEISLHARIIAVADSYDAMTTHRTFGKALSEEDAINEMKRCSGTQFDPAIAQILIEMVLEKVLK
jgi:diguanylate cyclase (GGDEF)-like protein/PAS domain S-box-containing protein/putative nucleotidyltransferase with HDIG domain